VEVADWSKLPAHPLVSVCMITYNHAPYIREALDSVLAQQVDFPYEICVGEDDSTDDTRDICRAYARRYPDTIRLFLRDRTNPARQRYKVPFAHNGEATYQACRGPYVAFVDGDDYWISPTKLARQVAALESNPAAMVAAHYTLRIPQQEPWKAHLVPDLPLRELAIENLLRASFYIHTSSLLVRRRDDIDREVFRHAPCGDVPLLFCQLLHGAGIMLPQVMSVYRIHDGGVFGAQPMVSQARQTVALWESLQPFVPRSLRALHQQGYIRILADATAEYRRYGLAKEACRSFRQGLAAVGALEASSWGGQLSRTADVVESLLFPRARRIRQRLWARVRSRRWTPGFDGVAALRLEPSAV
jgi:hypothetical protein